MPSDSPKLHQTPLAQWHKAQNAKMVDFAGWEMPISYPHGAVAEHMACDETASLFDVGHMAVHNFQAGADAERLMSTVSSADTTAIRPGKSTYVLLLNEAGQIIDDAIISRLHDGSLKMVSNSSRKSEVDALLAAGSAALGFKPPLHPTAPYALIALQGAQARRMLGALLPAAESLPFRGNMNAEITLPSVHAPVHAPVFVASIGYTGRDGFEIETSAEAAAPLMDALLAQGAVPAGLAARNTLRLEAGLPLYGHELTESMPAHAVGLGWVFSKRRRAQAETDSSFYAAQLIPTLAQASRLFGVRATGRNPLRDDDLLLHASGEPPFARLTSGGFSPKLNCGIGLALADAEDSLPAIGTAVLAQRGKRQIDATVVALPFVPASQYRGS